jgi:hypothetical protein
MLLWMVVGFAVVLGACHKNASNVVMIRADRVVSQPTAFPVASDPARVGTYPGETKSGAGYFYDEVLEYRVWFHPERGAVRLNGDDDYFMTFATYEHAQAVSTILPGAEYPLVLVRQIESINEPEPNHYVHVKEPRITEWQVRWLAGSRRTPTSIREFMLHPQPILH